MKTILTPEQQLRRSVQKAISQIRSISPKSMERDEISDALQESALTHSSHPEGTTIEDFSASFGAAILVINIMKIVDAIGKSKKSIIFPENEFNEHVLRPNQSNVGGLIIISLLALRSGQIYTAFLSHRIHPLIDKFCAEADKRSLPDLVYNYRKYYPETRIPLNAKLNEFVKYVRELSNSAEIKNEIKNHLRSSKKNERELSVYIDKIFNKYSRVMVLRIDLGYKKEFTKNHSAFPIEHLKKARSHCAKFLKKMRETVLKEVWIGYAWKLEYGPDKSYHYHFLIFLDGAQVREDVTITKIIGDYWKDSVTEGAGVYFNCNAIKERYTHRGVGNIDYSDQIAINNLKNFVVTYLCKRDKYIRLFLNDGGRTFGKGEMPYHRMPGAGRPRRKI